MVTPPVVVPCRDDESRPRTMPRDGSAGRTTDVVYLMSALRGSVDQVLTRSTCLSSVVMVERPGGFDRTISRLCPRGRRVHAFRRSRAGRGGSRPRAPGPPVQRELDE